jgi:hypothetical protein
VYSPHSSHLPLALSFCLPVHMSATQSKPSAVGCVNSSHALQFPSTDKNYPSSHFLVIHYLPSSDTYWLSAQASQIPFVSSFSLDLHLFGPHV